MQIFEERVGVKNANTSKFRRRYERLQRQVDNGQYHTSILKLLEDLADEIARVNRESKDSMKVVDYKNDKFLINSVS